MTAAQNPWIGAALAALVAIVALQSCTAAVAVAATSGPRRSQLATGLVETFGAERRKSMATELPGHPPAEGSSVSPRTSHDEAGRAASLASSSVAGCYAVGRTSRRRGRPKERQWR